MIGNAPGRKECHAVIAEDAADVFEQSRLQFRRDQWLPMFGAEDDVTRETCV